MHCVKASARGPGAVSVGEQQLFVSWIVSGLERNRREKNYRTKQESTKRGHVARGENEAKLRKAPNLGTGDVLLDGCLT